MKYILIAAFSLLHFSLFAQTSKIAVRYTNDSSIVGTGVVVVAPETTELSITENNVPPPPPGNVIDKDV
jgi:hypothetical protein